MSTDVGVRRWARAGAGVAAAICGLGIAQVVAIGQPSAAPVTSMGSFIVATSPPALTEWAIATFGSADKLVLHLGIALVATGIAAVAGLLTSRRPVSGAALLAGVGALCALVARLDPGASVWSPIPSLVGGLVAALTLYKLASSRSGPAANVVVARDGPVPTRRPNGPDRRSVLGSLGAAAVGLGAGTLGLGLGRTGSPPVGALPSVRSPLPALPPGLELHAPGVSPLQTAVSQFYRIDTALVVPRISRDEWRLSIDGMVDAPYTLTLDELLAMPMVEHDATMLCVSNEIGGDLIGSARWTGVLVADLIRRAAPRESGDMVLSRSVDGWTASTPLEVLLDGRRALIAVGMNGAPLTPTHGAPARLVTPGLYGYVGATKWLSSLTLTTFEQDQAYWTVRGWSARGPVKTGSRIDTPRAGAFLRAGTGSIAGVAWATHRGVKAVEVRIDDGPWQRARLGPDVGIDYWRQWMLPWTATPGRHRLTVRAIDGTDVRQTAVPADPHPDGATGWHTVEVEVR